MDIGARTRVIAVPPARDGEPVRVLAPLTPDRHAGGDGRRACHRATVAMAAPGSSWVPLCARRAPQGSPPALVHAWPVKIVPGRQTDGTAAPWLQTLPTLGLGPAAWRPDAAMGSWRPRLRPRPTVIEPRAPHLRPMQQARTLMPIQLREVRTDSTGGTGQAIRRAVVQGERAPLTRAP